MSRSTKIAFHNRDKYIALGLNIAYYRKRQGMTQEQLAEKLNMNLAFIGQVEAPNIARAISMDTLFNISRVLNVPAYKFLHFDDD